MDALSGFDETCFVLSRHGDLKRRGQEQIFVLPERAIRIGGSGAEILELLREPHSTEDLIEKMKARYPEESGIAVAVETFVQEMFEMGGIVSQGGDSHEETNT